MQPQTKRVMAHSTEYIEKGVHIVEVDARHLESGLVQAVHLLNQRQHFVILLTHYKDLLKTRHWLDYELLSQLMGVRIGRLEDKDEVLAMPNHFRPVRVDSIEGYIHGALEETLHHAPDDTGHSLADRIDKVLTNRWLGFPILIAVLYAVFELTFAIGSYPQEWIANGVDVLCVWLDGLWADGWFSSLIIDGIVRGVGAVLSFVPNILILFVLLALMEDSGYMARAAFLMDKIMHAVGLHGRSFIPMLVGFGCNVPAIMAARDIDNIKDRTLTMLMIPFMSCSARLPVYMLFVSAFFPGHKALVMMSLYAIGIVLSIVFALVMKRTKWFRQPEGDYVSELPRFCRPQFKELCKHVGGRLWDYLQKIGTVIIWASIVIWALTYFPSRSMDLEHSYLAMIGQWTEPLVQPLGFDWKTSVCLLTGLPAKEAIISTMGILYGGDATTSAFTPLTAFTFMLFVLLYFPCVATVATLRREAGRRWAWFTVVHSLLLAWLVAFVVYQVGSLF